MLKNAARFSTISYSIASLTPQYSGITHERLGSRGMQWPVPGEDHYGTQFLHKDRFTRGKGLFMPVEARKSDELPDKEYPFLLTTGRKHTQYNTSTRHSQVLEEHSPEEYAELNPLDAKRLKLDDGEIVKIASRRGELRTKVRITDRVPQSVVFMTLHYAESPVNVLTNAAHCKVSKTYEYKVCAVKISKIKAGKRNKS
jgi:formate dehydrogenase alpha subunit